MRDIEIACRDLLLPHLDAGEDSVGTRVEIEHLAPTLEGAEVAIEVRVVVGRHDGLGHLLREGKIKPHG